MVLVNLAVVSKMVLMLGHVYLAIPLMILPSIHHTIMALMAVLVVHVKVVTKCGIHRRARRRRRVVIERSSRRVR